MRVSGISRFGNMRGEVPAFAGMTFVPCRRFTCCHPREGGDLEGKHMRG